MKSTSRRGPRRAFACAAFACAAFACETFTTAKAIAQACCAGAAVTPARLANHEDALVAIQARAGVVFGSYDENAAYSRASRGSNEQDFEQSIAATFRVFKRAQIGVVVPFDETHRAATGIDDVGGGIGDISVNARYDFTFAGASLVVPGIALVAGVTLPTGRAPDQASHPLAADATGIGAFQITGGLAIEQTFGRWLALAQALISARTTRTVGDISETLGVQTSLLGAFGYAFRNDAAVAVTFSYVFEPDAHTNGQIEPNSARALATVGLAGALPIDDEWRLQSTLSSNLPADALGKNQLASVAFTATLVRAWM